MRSFLGATTTTLKDKLKKYNIDKCKTIILDNGGIDADNGVDLDSFCDNYIALFERLASDNCRLIVYGLLPRKTANSEPYNEQRSPCSEKDIEFNEHKSYLSSRQHAKESEKELTDFTTVQSGVPQGSILAPTLFLIFINALPLYFKKCPSDLYVHDTSINT